MKTSMTEKQEIQIRKTMRQWEARQRVNGNAFVFFCLASFISFALFLLNPCTDTGWLLFISLALMLFSGGSMFRSAYVVAQLQQLLEFPVISTPSPRVFTSQITALDVVDAEVVGPSRY